MKNGKKTIITADAKLRQIHTDGDPAALAILAMATIDRLIRYDPMPDASINMRRLFDDFFTHTDDDDRHDWVEGIKSAYRLASSMTPRKEDEESSDDVPNGKYLVKADERLSNLIIKGDRTGIVILAAIMIDQALKSPRIPSEDDSAVLFLNDFLEKLNDEEDREKWVKCAILAYRHALDDAREDEDDEQTDSEI